jgi:hypothetical protein
MDTKIRGETDMRRTIPTVLALSLVLGATPVLAQDEEATPDEATTERTEVLALGFAIDFPADWRVNLPEGERVSALTDAEGEPVMETTLIYANAGGGTVCDVDAYLDMPAESDLESFAFQLVNYLQQTESSDAAMVVGEEELPVGPAYHIEIFNQESGRIRAIYLFDGPAREDGAFERYLLTCAAREVGEPFWADIAESIEFLEPMATDEDPEMTESEGMAEDPTGDEMADDEMAEEPGEDEMTEAADGEEEAEAPEDD